MITAEQIQLKYLDNYQSSNKTGMLIEFAKEAIKADRLNLLEHAEVYFDEGTDLENVHIDKDSILNAPNIELL